MALRAGYPPMTEPETIAGMVERAERLEGPPPALEGLRWALEPTLERRREPHPRARANWPIPPAPWDPEPAGDGELPHPDEGGYAELVARAG